MAFVTPVVDHWLEREICYQGEHIKVCLIHHRSVELIFNEHWKQETKKYLLKSKSVPCARYLDKSY